MNAEDYEKFEASLRHVGADLYPAEAHGLLCGMLCAAAPVAVDPWIDQVLGETEQGDVLVAECRQVLQALHEMTSKQMENEEMDFALLLPGDDATLGTRAVALGDWCQSFVYGLAVSGVGAGGETVPGDAGELLKDLVEISRAGLGEDDDLEEEEAAYAELEEYVRVGVMLINEELRGKRPQNGTRH